jgi:hypothetical protein
LTPRGGTPSPTRSRAHQAACARTGPAPSTGVRVDNQGRAPAAPSLMVHPSPASSAIEALSGTEEPRDGDLESIPGAGVLPGAGAGRAAGDVAQGAAPAGSCASPVAGLRSARHWRSGAGSRCALCSLRAARILRSTRHAGSGRTAPPSPPFSSWRWRSPRRSSASPRCRASRPRSTGATSASSRREPCPVRRRGAGRDQVSEWLHVVELRRVNESQEHVADVLDQPRLQKLFTGPPFPRLEVPPPGAPP